MKLTSGPAQTLSPQSILWITAGVALAMLPLITHVPAWILLLAAAALGARMVSALRDKPLRLGRLLPAGAALAAAAIYVYHGTLNGRDAGITLLVLMLSLKTLEMNQHRDAMIAVFLTFFLLLTSFFYSQSIPVALYMCPVVVYLGACLIHINEGPVPLGARARLRMSTMMFIRSLPLMLIMFVLFPRLSGPLWSVFDQSDTAISGISNEMTPGNISELILSDATAFRVTFEGEPPPPQQRYWRGAVFWRYDGKSWTPRFPTRAQTPPRPPEEQLVNYTVSLEPHDNNWLFALDTPIETPEGSTINADFQVISAEPIKKLRTYSAVSSPGYRSTRKLSGLERKMALDLPPQAAPRARELASRWLDSSTDDADLVRTALEHFTTQEFVYTLTPPKVTTDSVDEFLFDTRRGFCEHYSSSFVVLMRAAGIPARIVVGYLGGDWNTLGDYLHVRQADAHAWTEVWLQGRGWTRVDPTAAVSPERVELGIRDTISRSESVPFFTRVSHTNQWLNRASMIWDTANFHWNEWVVAFDPKRQLRFMQQLGFSNAAGRTLLLTMIGALAALAGLYALIAHWRAKTRNYDPLVAAYARFCAKASAAGVERKLSEGPRDFADRFAELRPELADSVTRIANLYSRLRYGRGDHPREVARLKKLVGELKV